MVKYVLNSIILYQLLLFVNGRSFEIKVEDTSIVMVQTALRHGFRAPVGVYPNYAVPSSFWENMGGLGELTYVGVLQMNSFGRYLRNYYENLNETYHASRVYARSTDFARTLESCYSFFSGFFSPTTNEQKKIYEGSTNFKPIAVHTENILTDKIFRFVNCSRIFQLRDQTLNSKEYMEKQSENFEFLKNLSSFTGINFTNDYYNVYKIYDNAVVDLAHNLTLDPWIIQNFPMIKIANNFGWRSLFSTIESAKLISGGLLNSIVTNIQQKVNGSKYEFFLYGLHDYNLIGLQKLLNPKISITENFTPPKFGSAIIFELRKDSFENYYVQVLYKNSDYSGPIELNVLQIQDCNNLCPIEKFYELTKEFIISDYDASGACNYLNTNLTKS